MLIIWGRPNSHNVKKVVWAAEEAGMLYERRDIGGSFGYTDAYLAMNPNKLVPTIDDHGFILWESNAILRYLASQYAGELWPTDLQIRASADRWMDWSQASLQPAFLTGVFWGFYRTPPHLRDWAAIGKSMELCTQYFRLLDQVLSNQSFLAGEMLTLADISAGTALYRYFELDLERPHLPNVQAWYQRLSQRAAYQEHVMVPFSELRGRLDY